MMHAKIKDFQRDYGRRILKSLIKIDNIITLSIELLVVSLNHILFMLHVKKNVLKRMFGKSVTEIMQFQRYEGTGNQLATGVGSAQKILEIKRNIPQNFLKGI